MKPYLKLAYTLIAVGMGLFMAERYGLGELSKNGSLHLDGTLLSILVIAPILLVLAGCVIFMVGKLRRL